MRSVFRFLILSLLLTLFVFTCANAAVNPDDSAQLPVLQTIRSEEQLSEEAPDVQQTASTLPAALQVIDENAFEGTALVSVELPEKLEYIGDEAFAGITSLRSVRIPDNTKYIGKDAFTGSGQVTITAYANSYARTWARNNRIPFAPVAALTASNGSLQITGINSNKTTQNQLTSTETTETPKYSEQNGRAEGEIKAAKHEECFAYSIQGRSPPMEG